MKGIITAATIVASMLGAFGGGTAPAEARQTDNKIQGAVAAASNAGVATQSSTSKAASTPLIVSAGDSYASGHGHGNGDSGKCRRSIEAFGQKFKDKLTGVSGAQRYTNIACSGFTSNQVLNSNNNGESSTQMQQIDKLNPATVVLTVGGNDIDFAAKAVAMTYGGSCPSQDKAFTSGIAKLKGNLPKIFAAVRAGAPGVTMIATGYPDLVNPNHACYKAVRDLLVNLNGTIAGAVNDYVEKNNGAPVYFVGFAGVLGWDPSPYLFGPCSTSACTDLFHPNSAGHDLLAERVLGTYWRRLFCRTADSFSTKMWANKDLSGQPDKTGTSSCVAESWGMSGPWGTVGSDGYEPQRSDNFSVEWTGKVKFSKTRTYTFLTRADDGIRVKFGSKTLIDSWNDQTAVVNTRDYAVKAGTYTVTVSYYEHGGGAIAEFLIR